MDQAIERITGAAEFVLPEIILVLTVCAHFLAGPFLVSPSGEAPAGLRHRWGWLALIGLGTAIGVWLGYDVPATEGAFLGPFHVDELTTLIRGFSFASGLVLILLSWNQVGDAHSAEFHGCLLLILAGLNLVAAANDLVGLFLALEVVSIPTYVFLYLGKHDAEGQEATIKYFLISVFSSAMTLFGFSYLFGITGTTNLTGLHGALAAGSTEAMPPLIYVAIVMIVAGLAFRVTAFPFHFYAPDVFQGTAATGAAMLSVVPKIAGFAALAQLLIPPASIEIPPDAVWTFASAAAPILWVLAAASILIGNMVALQQTDLRRLLAWSSIAHAGYMLIGLTVATGAGPGGLEALLFYLAAYAAMTVGAFAVLIAVGRRYNKTLATIDDLSGLSRVRPMGALAMTVFLLSLIGLPPTAGFLGKLNLLLTAWSATTPLPNMPDARWLAVVLIAGAAIGAFYYLRLIGAMYLGEAKDTKESAGPMDVPAAIGVAVCAAATILFFAAPNLIWPWIQQL